MFLKALESTLPQALIFAPYVLGIAYTYSVIRKTDLTPEGSFVLGGVTFAQAIMASNNYFFATIVATLVGSLSGALTRIIQRYSSINDILSGLLVVFMLYSINLIILGRPNISLFQFEIPDWMTLGLSQTNIAALISLLLVLAVTFGMKGKFGLRCIAYGSNPTQLEKLGASSHKTALATFMLSNGLAAFAGAQTAITHGFADVNMGLGTAFVGITTCVIGQTLYPRKKNLWKSFGTSDFRSFAILYHHHTYGPLPLPTKNI